jgi:uncharacterized protein (DUF2141 family)
MPLQAPPVSDSARGFLTVAVGGIEHDGGEIGCALYRSPEGFPLDPGPATLQWHDARRTGVTCEFRDVVAGTYAVAVSHDRNGNRRTDRTVFGLPREAWGVSNNIRPRLRAPRFEEAAFAVRPGQTLTLSIEVDQ